MPTPRVGRGDVIRLIALLLLFAMATSFMIMARSRAARPETPAASPVVEGDIQVTPEWARDVNIQTQPDVPPLPALPPPTEPFVPNPGILADVQDRTRVLEPRAYVHLLHLVNGNTDAALRAEAKEEERRDVFWHEPGPRRGQVWFVRGTFCGEQYEPVTVDCPNPSGVSGVFRAAIVDHRDRPLNVIYVDKERELKRDEDVVETAAVFFKIQQIAAADGKDRNIPVFVARTLTRYDAPKTGTHSMTIAGTVASLLIAGLVTILVWHGIRSSGTVVDAFRGRHPRRVDSERLKDAALRHRTPPPPPPPTSPA